MTAPADDLNPPTAWDLAHPDKSGGGVAAAPADDLVARLNAASHDERLSTGMLYRESADEIERLQAERDTFRRDWHKAMDELAAMRGIEASAAAAEAELAALKQREYLVDAPPGVKDTSEPLV